MQIAPVDRANLAAIYPHIEPLIAKHVEHSRGEYTMDSVGVDLASGTNEYWIAYDPEKDRAVGLLCTSQVQDGSGRGVMCITWAVGESNRRTEWAKPALEALESVARERGHFKLVTVARKGWARDELKDFKVTRWIYELELAA